MMISSDLILALVTLLLTVQFSFAHLHKLDDPKLLLVVSFDGFRWDFLSRLGKARAPNFYSLIESGVQAKWVVDAFVTKTFPNHFTIVTGLWEESHGIVANMMFDPKFNRTFSVRNTSAKEDPFWWNSGGAVPIWIANELEDDDRHSGTIFWPGCVTSYKGKRQSRNHGKYNQSFPFKKIVDEMIGWFTDHHNPINFGAMYFNEPDQMEHKYGPSDPRILDEIAKLDKEVVGYLIKELKEHDLFDKVNIIITSDHGFSDISKDRVVKIYEHVDLSLFKRVGHTPVMGVIPNKGHEEEVYRSLKNISHVTVYKKADIPERLHYSKNRRIAPIIVIADEGWVIQYSKEEDYFVNRTKGGSHGYNNSLMCMHQFFIAHGPAFKQGYKRGPISIVDMYPLMAKVLKLSDSSLGPNNGSLANVIDMLDPGHHTYDMKTTFVTFILVIVGASLITGIFSIVVIRQQRVHAVRRFRLLNTDGLINESAQPMMSANDEEL